MTTGQKVTLVAAVWETHGLESALAAVGLPKSTWYYHRNQKVSYEEKYAYLLPDLEAIARQHTEYGWPRVTVELREEYKHHVNQSSTTAHQDVGLAYYAQHSPTQAQWH